MARNIFLYISIVGFFVLATWLLLFTGSKILPVSAVAAGLPGGHPGSAVFPAESAVQPAFSRLLLQIIVILTVARVFGVLATKVGQQPVIGEIVAGIFLGPSVLGWLWPGASDVIFPQGSLPSLHAISQFGLIFFMFIIGTELDWRTMRNHSRGAVLISHAVIAFSFFLGVVFSLLTFRGYAPPGVRFLPYALFMGIALSITAFPVLARILRERNLMDTPLGALALACAATDDFTAWCLLAAVIAIVKAGSLAAALVTFVLALGYVIFMVFLVRIQLNRWIANYLTPYKDSRIVVSGVFLILLISAYLSELIGIHALFGAFIAGVVMSEQTSLKEALREKLEDVSVLVLLPVFFAYTGLRTQIGLLGGQDLWGLCGLVILMAVLGKFGGSSILAKLTGRSWWQALSLGALMNTRGLMELIVLNIGCDLGILSPQIFAMLVLMALITTFLTGPMLRLINRLFNVPMYTAESTVKL